MNLEAICNNLEIISSFSILFPLLSIFLSRKRISSIYVPLVLLIVAGFITEVLNLYFLIRNQNNYLVIRCYTFFEISLITYFYYSFFRKHFNSKWFLLIILIFPFIALIDYNLNGDENFDNYAVAFEAISFSIISLWAFYYLMKKVLFENLTNEPFFWFNCGVLLYFGANLVLFIFDNYLLKYRTSGHIALWAIHSILNIFYNSILAVGFWKTKRP
jgi:hypothetical protein